MPDPDDRPFSPPDIVVKIKALACELPCESGLPLSRYSNSEIAAEAIRRGIVAEISGATIWEVARPGCHSALAVAQLDLPTGPAV